MAKANPTMGDHAQRLYILAEDIGDGARDLQAILNAAYLADNDQQRMELVSAAQKFASFFLSNTSGSVVDAANSVAPEIEGEG